MHVFRFLLLGIAVIVIPFLLIQLLVPKEEDIEFQYGSNMSVRVKREQSGQIDLVPFEEYVAGVLAGEMPISFEMEALKAQAVAARSYVMRKMAENKDNDYDVVDTVMNQVYLDDSHLQTVWKETYDDKVKKLKQAVMETSGEYLEYQGKVADALFFSTSVGKTENSEEVFVSKVEYLRSVDSPWDEKESSVFRDKATFTKTNFYQKLGLPVSDGLQTNIVSETSTGRVREIKVNGTVLTGREFASKLSLRSNFFTIEQSSDKIEIHTTGYGHGVGMSQYGANGMAKEGYLYDAILKHYYSGISIKKI